MLTPIARRNKASLPNSEALESHGGLRFLIFHRIVRST
jgi:hypothetical protein